MLRDQFAPFHYVSRTRRGSYADDVLSMRTRRPRATSSVIRRTRTSQLTSHKSEVVSTLRDIHEGGNNEQCAEDSRYL